MPSLSDILSYFLAAILTFFGLIFLIAASLDPWRIFPGISLLMIAGLLIYLRNLAAQAKAREERIEAEVIRLAKRKGGYVSIADVSSELNIPVEKARKILEGLERKGVAFLDFKRIGDEGIEVYRILGTDRSD